MNGAQELLHALRTARQCTADAAKAATPGSVAAQAASVDGLEACLKRGLPALSEAEAEAVAGELKQLLQDNRFALRWSQIRSQWARIGQPAPEKKAAPGPRLDLVS